MSDIRIHCKKDFKGMIDIRDFMVRNAINEGKSITVTCGSFPGKSVYTPEELKNPVSINGPFNDKFIPGKTYKLHSYYWKSDEEF